MHGNGIPHLVQKKNASFCCLNTYLKELNQFIFPADVYMYRISSNKRRASYKCRPLISTTPLGIYIE